LVEIDGQQAYSSLKAVQRFLGVGDVINEIRVKAESIEAARGLRDRIQKQLGHQVTVIDWQERNKNLFNALQLERIAMFLVLTINILLAAFSITSTLVMSLIERRREISILRAIGAESKSMRWIFISQGLTAGAVGSILGVFIGGTACALLATFGLPLNAEEVYYISSIPVEVRAYDLMAILLVALGVSALSTIYPAYYAAKIQPVEGIKGQ
jgi:lipoprotein-releasing system permease protein